MEELIVTREELVDMFEKQTIDDTGSAWLMNNKAIDIIALHEVDPKFLQDVTNSKFYKIIVKN